MQNYERRVAIVEQALSSFKEDSTQKQEYFQHRLEELERVVRRQVSASESSHNGQVSLQKSLDLLRQQLSKTQLQVENQQTKIDTWKNENIKEIRGTHINLNNLNSKLTHEVELIYKDQRDTREFVAQTIKRELHEFRHANHSRMNDLENDVLNIKRNNEKNTMELQNLLNEMVVDYEQFRTTVKQIFLEYKNRFEEKIHQSTIHSHKTASNIKSVLKAEIETRTTTHKSIEGELGDHMNLIKKELQDRRIEMKEMWHNISVQIQTMLVGRLSQCNEKQSNRQYLDIPSFHSFEEQHKRDLTNIVYLIRDMETRIENISQNWNPEPTILDENNSKPSLLVVSPKPLFKKTIFENEVLITSKILKEESTVKINKSDHIEKENKPVMVVKEEKLAEAQKETEKIIIKEKEESPIKLEETPVMVVEKEKPAEAEKVTEQISINEKEESPIKLEETIDKEQNDNEILTKEEQTEEADDESYQNDEFEKDQEVEEETVTTIEPEIKKSAVESVEENSDDHLVKVEG